MSSGSVLCSCIMYLLDRPATNLTVVLGSVLLQFAALKMAG